MRKSFYLPPGFVIRPVNNSDTWKLKSLLWNWRENDSVLSSLNSTWTFIAVVFILLLIANIILFALLLIIYFLYEFSIKNYSGFWTVEYQKKLVACAELRKRRGCSVIFNLFVKQEYRHQKLGSCLIEHLIHEGKKPIYLSCISDLIPFYNNFGFIAISPEQVPRELLLELTLSKELSIVPLVLF
jgi:N-acetylglutamate synthase-like GNAT family acetyltransferase